MMTGEEFKNLLQRRGYPYRIDGDYIIVGTEYKDDYTPREAEDLSFIENSIPPNVIFINHGNLVLKYLREIPENVKFYNSGWIDLTTVKFIRTEIEFNNEDDVYLGFLVGRWFSEWENNIEGIDSKMLLNLMIKKGLFV